MGTKCLFSTSHHLQTNGLTERHHCSIEQVLRSFISKTGNERVWAKHLSFCGFALSSTVPTSTRKAPFQLVYGKNVMVPLNYLTGTTQLSYVRAFGEMAEEVS